MANIGHSVESTKNLKQGKDVAPVHHTSDERQKRRFTNICESRNKGVYVNSVIVLTIFLEKEIAGAVSAVRYIMTMRNALKVESGILTAAKNIM